MKKYLTKNLCFLLTVIMLLVMGGCSTGAADAADPGRETESPTDTIPIETTTATVPTTEPEYQDSTEPGPVETTPNEIPDNTTPTTEPVQTTIPAGHIHSYTATVVAPTCTIQGYTQYKCSCGYSYRGAQTASLGHNYTERVVAPTTENKGYTEHVCGLCGHSYKDNYTDKLPVVESTEPTVCQHNWQAKYYPEQGHYSEYFIVCKCGYRCGTTEEWTAHRNTFSGEDLVLNHGGWGSSRDYIVDSPGRWEWVCSDCGAVTDTQP